MGAQQSSQPLHSLTAERTQVVIMKNGASLQATQLNGMSSMLYPQWYRYAAFAERSAARKREDQFTFSAPSSDTSTV